MINKNIRFKLSYKIMAAMYILTIVPLLVISLVLQFKTKEFYNNNTKQLYEQLSTQYLENIRYKYNNYNSMIGSVISLGGVRELLNTKAESFSEIYTEATRLSSALSTTRAYYNSNNEMHNLMIYSMKEKPTIYTTRIVTYKDGLHHDIINEQNVKNKYHIYTNPLNKKIISFIYPISSSYSNSKDIIAYIVMEIDADKFFHISSEKYNRYASQLAVSVKDNNGKMIWESHDESQFNDKELNQEPLYSIESSDLLSDLQWTISVQFLTGNYKQLNQLKYNIIFITVVLLLINLLFAFLFSKKLTQRIRVLINKMDNVQNGNMTVSIKVPGNDELNIIDSYFDKMVYELKEYINENFLQQIAYKEAQLNILQNQINPHFLYNTLEVIDSMATTTGNFEICDICNKLGHIFRYNVSRSGREFVTFRDELNHIKNYIAIQKVRFTDRFDIQYDIEDSCYNVKMLKFILQPLVENAIVHALENREDGGVLEIKASMKDKLEIIISDNGRGFDEKILKEINEFILEKIDSNHVDFSGGIGLKNVITRIKLVYNNEATIKIDSNSNGTRIILCLKDINSM